ncbi:MAG: hypothetical protein ABR520_06795 [Mycobacteriales bacterium]|nr:hypothetical protein [Frankia sp.]
MAGYSSYLRVYEPITAFPAAERRRWEQFFRSRPAPDPALAVRNEHRAALVQAIGLPPRVDVDQAFIHRRDGVTYVCPWRTDVRSWQAVTDFRRELPDVIADAFIPRATAERAARELEQWRRADPPLKLHILSATWEVPTRWFLPFEGEERVLRLAPERSLTYVTAMGNARRRIARGLAVLRRTMEDGPLLDGVDELGDWLEDYHPRSLVELDYGGLVSLFTDDELYDDESAADVAHAIASLAAGDSEEAVVAYRRLSDRWGSVRGVEAAN